MGITSLLGKASPAASHTVATSLARAAATTQTQDDGTTVTSTDFLSLLVTEMKNQDPTQPTDPNAYIQQLVGVNSLQQLIQINGELSGVTASGSAAAAPVGAV